MVLAKSMTKAASIAGSLILFQPKTVTVKNYYHMKAWSQWEDRRQHFVNVIKESKLMVCFLTDSDPCTPDAPPAATSPPTSEEPGPFTAPASPSCSSDTGTASFSPPLPACVAALCPKPPPISPSTSTSAATAHPGLPSLPAPPASTPSLHPGIYLPVVPPSGATHLINWLPFLASATLATIQGKEEDQPPVRTGSLEGVKCCSSPPPQPSHDENPQAAPMGNSTLGAASPPPAAHAMPPSSEQASANVSDILAELRTMNGHLSTIARALTQLASSLAPQQEARGTPPP
ncbi:proline-rich receptor-like protein kinase PERK9 [Willisornis vidua]|uniref:Proline-rich receptor-like protein kinase PERK9 n=1 Tax=Willisornis vidua TaxID=1566151 RepID=A0ABQ9D8E9_9PASS|nr:proline-rich receptor-like protein kinase PERK9 [Willisornis vidua]